MKKTLALQLILLFFFVHLSSDNINFSPGQVFPGVQVQFGIQGGGPPQAQYSYIWNFGDGTSPVSGAQATVTHTFKEPGNYNVTCIKSSGNGGGSPRTITKRITVVERRTIRATGSSFMAGNPVSFQTNHFVESSLNWDFGDGSISTGPKNRDHTYSNTGNYTIKVKDYAGLSSSVISCTINVIPDNRSITNQPSSPMAGQDITFQAVNFSSANLKWDFGDGTIQNGGKSKDHKYSSQGNFKVRVTDLAISQNSYIEQTIKIAPDNRSITMNPSTPSLYEEVTFNAVNFTSGSIEWDFGRGVRKTGGPMQKFTFSNRGNFNIQAREVGSTSPKVKKQILINQDKRKIRLQPSSALVGQQIMIKLINSSANTVKWKIGNNNSLNNSPKEIQYQFKDPGRVEITAEIQGQSKLRDFIIISDNRKLETGSTHIFEKCEVKITTRNFNSSMLKWEMGDGTIRNGGKEFTYKYLKPGNFIVKVYDFEGKSNIPVQMRLNVSKENREIFTRKKSIFVGSDVEFEARNFIDNRVRWNFGNGIEKRGSRKISHKFRRAGTFKVFALDFDGKGSKKIELTFNVVRDNRRLEFGKDLIAGVPVSIKMNNSNGGTFEWKFPDGKKASGQNPGEVIFNTPGIKEIIVSDRSGLYPPLKKTITILPDTRTLEVERGTILKNENLKVFAKNFKGMQVKWDFGDGTPKKILAKNTTTPWEEVLAPIPISSISSLSIRTSPPSIERHSFKLGLLSGFIVLVLNIG